MEYGQPCVGGARGPLVGRADDVRRIRALLEPGTGQALVISGEAGVGKTAVLDAVAAAMAAAGTRVLRAAGAEFEADISYAGLNHLLFSLRGALGGLDEIHREALTVALGLARGAPPDRLLVCNATLILLQEAARSGPLLLVVDDFPWLDRASRAVLGFVARRLGGSTISVLGAARTYVGGSEGAGLVEYELPPLTDEAADALILGRFPDLPRPVRSRLSSAARGNPLALLELPAALRSTQRTAQEELPAVLPLGKRLHDLFVRRVSRLPAPSLRLLLLATLEGRGDLGVMLAAAGLQDGTMDLDALAPAERDDLIDIDHFSGRLIFRHPLIRSGVVAASTSADRRSAHQALAASLPRHPERQAWHLAEASVTPDEQVAGRLEQAARLIMGRGDAVGAVKALTRAGHLSPSDTDRARRLAEAAYIGADAAGALRAASELLEDARQADPNLGASLRAASTAVMLVLNRDGSVDTAHRLLAGAVEAGGHLYDAGDETLVDALHLLVLVCFFGGREELWAPLYAALDRLRPGVPELLSAVMQTFADPARTAAAARRQVGDMLGRLHDASDPAYIVRAGSASLYADRLGDVRDASWRIVHQGRDGGPARRHIGGLMHLCLDDYLTGRWDEVLDLATEGTAVCDDSGYDFFRWYFEYCRAIVAAARGDVDTSGALADHITQWALPRGVLVAADYANHCRATAALGTGDFESAFHHAEEISPAGTLASHRPHAVWVVMDLVEAAVRTNRLEKATAHVRAVQESGAAGISPRHTLLTLGSAALCAPTDDESLALFEKALSVPDLERRPFDTARVQLAYGERLRRARATVEARKALKSATDTFRQLGARPWAERAAKELRASGWTQARTAAPGAQLLTPQELEIARLAASGLTNKQIAARLFLSHRTVGSHLYQIFPKLGIGSRAALGDALAKAMPDD